MGGNMASDLLLMLVVLAIHCSEHFVNSVITDVRLVGGPSSSKGTVELRENNERWETTCGINLSINDVIVICRNLGFTGANRALTDTPYGQDSTPDSVLNCDGSEADLSGCNLNAASCSSTAGAATCHGTGYLGCFVDNSNMRVLPGDSLVDEPALNVSKCLQFCKDSIAGNYTYAGVENGKECYCGEHGVNYSKLGVQTDASCHVQCSGDPNGSCGGLGHIAVFTINIQPPATPGVSPTDSVGTTDTGRDITSSSMTLLITSATSHKPSPGLPQNENNIASYAGIGGGVVILIIIIIVVILVVSLMRKRSRKQQKDRLQSYGMTVMQPAIPNGGQDNLYHNMFQDNTDETPNSSQIPAPSAEGDGTYYSSVKDQQSAEGDDTYYSSVKDQKTADEDSKPNNATSSNQYDGLPETGVVRLPPHGDAATMYAMPDKQGRKSQGEDFGALYAKSDKTGNTGDGQPSEDFGILYAMPDKTRGMPEGREDVKVSDLYAMPDKSQGQDHEGLDSERNNGEGLYPLADDDTGLYAMSTAPGQTVNSDDDYGTIMVDNELYAM